MPKKLTITVDAEVYNGLHSVIGPRRISRFLNDLARPSNGVMEFERGSTNVYADLGVPDADGMLIKAQLAARIGEIIKHRRLTQAGAAEIVGIPQPKLSSLLRGQFRGISETKMLNCLDPSGP